MREALALLEQRLGVREALALLEQLHEQVALAAAHDHLGEIQGDAGEMQGDVGRYEEGRCA